MNYELFRLGSLYGPNDPAFMYCTKCNPVPAGRERPDTYNFDGTTEECETLADAIKWAGDHEKRFHSEQVWDAVQWLNELGTKVLIQYTSEKKFIAYVGGSQLDGEYDTMSAVLKAVVESVGE